MQKDQPLSPSDPTRTFRLGQRVHSIGDTRRIGTVKYIGPVQGYSGTWVGVNWDNPSEGKHDGSINGVRYFQASSEKSGSFVRTHNLSHGISLLEALQLRYRVSSTKEEEDEMYVFSASNRRVSVELVGKEKIQDKVSRFDELIGVSLSSLGVSSAGDPSEIGATIPKLKELDLTGNLLSDWKDVVTICEQLPALSALNLTNNLMTRVVAELPQLKNIRLLVLNNTGVDWMQVEILKHSLPAIEELHLMGNNISKLELASSSTVQGFDSLRILNLEHNCIAEWEEILKLSQLRSLEQLYLNNNKLNRILYPDRGTCFETLCSLLVGGNNIEDLASIDSLNSFPKLTDIRLSENPITDSSRGGNTRFVLIARLAKVEMLNGSEENTHHSPLQCVYENQRLLKVSARERKESEIRYIRLVMSKLHDNPEQLRTLHPRFSELKKLHGIEDERPTVGASGPQKMASGLLAITLKCVGASIGEKPPMTKKLPATTTVGKLKMLCESFFKLKSIRPKLFLQEEGSPLPLLLDDEMASLMDIGIGNGSTILIDQED